MVFAAVAVLELAAAASVYLFRSVLHATLALAMLFLLNSIAFLVLGQPLLAIVQAFVVIGGIATYLIVATAAQQKTGFRHVRLSAFTAMLILLSIALDYSVYNTEFSNLPRNSFSTGGVLAMFSGISLLYLIVLMLFSVSMGSIMIFKMFKKEDAKGRKR